MERSALAFRLWVMMVLEFAIWGAWLPLIWGYMGPDGLAFTEPQVAWVGSAFAIASIVGIFFSSQFADRTFAAERQRHASRVRCWRVPLGFVTTSTDKLFSAVDVCRAAHRLDRTSTLVQSLKID